MSAQQRIVHRSWHLFDAENQVVGKLAGNVARFLIGKHKPNYDNRWDCGDNVVVVNVKKIVFMGKKFDEKKYRHHTGYPGGLREITAGKLMERFPERVLQKAVTGLLPKNSIRKERMKRLFVFPGPEHKFEEMFKDVGVIDRSRGKMKYPWEK